MRRVGTSDETVDTSVENPPPGMPGVSDRRAAIERGALVIGCDVPADGRADTHLPLPIRVIGWAHSRAGVDRVEVLIDGTRVPAQYGLPRADVAEALSEPDAARSGFTAVLDADICDVGPHTLTIVAADAAGETAKITVGIVAEEGSGPEDVHWTGLDNEGERYVPEDYRGTYTEVEHQARYSWAAQLVAGRDVLDAGCGVGWGTVRLARSARHAVGIDIDEPAVSNARERAAGSAEFVVGDLLALPFPDGSFDLVVCFEAIEHVADPQLALDELRRVLRPNGVLAVSSPNRGVYPEGNPHHIHELASEELEESLRSRFTNVAMYRQQTHLASLLSDDAAYAAHDPETQTRVNLLKLLGGRPGDELYTIGLAGDGELPAVESIAALGGTFETKPLHERINLLEHRVMLAEAQSEAARANEEAALQALEDARHNQAVAETARDAAQRAIADLEASASWQVTRPLRAAKRAALSSRTPRDSNSD
jgi:SAM-dependent methyltransferase